MPGPTRDQVVFLLNGERHEVPRQVPPTRTLLDYLREDLGLKGTKEGCNEGDCGACTVVVAEPDGSVARAINACITFVPMVDGMSVTTVEGLRGPQGELHPVQQAMVECHGSQCGFCTPGFVMSLYAAYVSPDEGERNVDDLLAGNLCRCTGYGPIVQAAKRALSAAPHPRVQARGRAPSPLPMESAGRGTVALALDHPDGKLFAPTTLDELVRLAARYPAATILGGATDVGLWVTKQMREVPVVISTRHVDALRAHGVRTREYRMGDTTTLSYYRIGAAATYAECIGGLVGYHPGIGELVRRLGSEQVRNVGTVGGNIANGSPIGDMPPALIALNSDIVLNGPQGQRRLPLKDYFLAYGKQDRKAGEVVEALWVPIGQPNDTRLRCYKISKRFDQDISAVCGCFRLTIESGTVASARVAFGGMAAIPKRATAVETALEGKPWTMATVEAALPEFAADFQPISDMRASAGYRLQVARNLLVRYFHETTSDAATRLVGSGERITAEVLS